MDSGAEDRTRLKFAVIPSNGRECLMDCIEAIEPQVDWVVIVDTGEGGHDWSKRPKVWRFFCDTRNNISHWWNHGLDACANIAAGESSCWDVAVLNDDATVPAGWFYAVSENMRNLGATAGCSGAYNYLLTRAEMVPLDYRMQGFAFMLAGESGLRANEKIHWYFSDDYVDWEARKRNGMAMVSGFPVQHLYPNGQMTPELQAQVAKDAGTFMNLYGRMPW